jgi:phosphoserine aminotransferase
MARVYNFSAGPAMLPTEVLEHAREEMLDWHGTGMSVMEMSHRGKHFVGIAERAEANLRKLMDIPDNYKVLFLQGGASAQFSAIPLNLGNGSGKADYLNTGHWSVKAIKEAGRFVDVNIVADTTPSNFTTLPAEGEISVSSDADYVHYTPNETIAGVEFPYIPDTGDVPLVADMSSTILSRPIDVSKFGVIYAGAQKNVGPAGLAIVIVRDDLLGRARENTPTVLDWTVQAQAHSMSNTPPTYAWYVAGLVFEHLLEKGGVEAMAEINKRKADKLYAVIDDNPFYRNPVEPAYRSWMNVPFMLADDSLNQTFLDQAAERDLVSLKGHRSVGGMRASIYNAMPESGVDALVEFMNDFARRHG